MSDRVHGVGGYPNRLRIQGFTFGLPEILRQYLYFGGGPPEYVRTSRRIVNQHKPNG